MPIYPLYSTEFKIQLVWKQKQYLMQAKLAHLGDGVERWQVSAGEKLMYFENNRPELQAAGRLRSVKWKMIKGIEYIKDPADGALLLTDIWEAIEKQSTGVKQRTFQDVRAPKV